MTPLRLAVSEPRSSSRERVEEIEGKVPCVGTWRELPILVEGVLERDEDCDGQYDGDIDALGDDEGVEAGVKRGVGGDDPNRCGGAGRGCR
jgi:hypothetical protein